MIYSQTTFFFNGLALFIINLVNFLSFWIQDPGTFGDKWDGRCFKLWREVISEQEGTCMRLWRYSINRPYNITNWTLSKKIILLWNVFWKRLRYSWEKSYIKLVFMIWGSWWEMSRLADIPQKYESNYFLKVFIFKEVLRIWWCCFVEKYVRCRWKWKDQILIYGRNAFR